jgi:NADH-quinone oxidoreductase subunit L
MVFSRLTLSWAVALTSLGVALLGLLLGWLTYGRKPLEDSRQPDPLASRLGPLFLAVERKWWVDELYQRVIVRPYEIVANFFAHPVDQGVIDGVVNGMGALVRSTAQTWRQIQNGYVAPMQVTILLGVVLVITYLILR